MTFIHNPDGSVIAFSPVAMKWDGYVFLTKDGGYHPMKRIAHTASSRLVLDRYLDELEKDILNSAAGVDTHNSSV